jgi:hypothetical protein
MTGPPHDAERNCDGTLSRVRRRHQEAARLAERRIIVTYTNCTRTIGEQTSYTIEAYAGNSEAHLRQEGRRPVPIVGTITKEH